MGITKNRQSEDVIRQMASAAFPLKQMINVEELTEGMCNAAYLIRFSDGSSSVLKIASGDGKGLMSNEVNLMDAEVRAMRIVHKLNKVKVADVQYYDKSKEICNGNYFFMEEIEGQSYSSVKDSYTEEEQRSINYEIGQTEKAITGICGNHFGLLGDDQHKYDNLFAFVYRLISVVLSDAEKKNIAIGVSGEEILLKLERDKKLFEMVKQPVLVHWDMWEGNIFVKDKHISGIIDWERAMWGEAFMDERFRRHSRNQEFLKGYGQESFTREEMCRICWYDIFLYLTMMAEGAYREYEDEGQYLWVKPLFEASWKDISKNVLYKTDVGNVETE